MTYNVRDGLVVATLAAIAFRKIHSFSKSIFSRNVCRGVVVTCRLVKAAEVDSRNVFSRIVRFLVGANGAADD